MTIFTMNAKELKAMMADKQIVMKDGRIINGK